MLALVACKQQAVVEVGPRPALVYQIPAESQASNTLYPGEIRARIEVDHAFRLNGKVVKRLIDAGSVVKKGQVLAKIDPEDALLAVDAASSQVAAQKADADFTEAEMKRFKDLFNKGFVSQSALDQKINLANAARARLQATTAQARVSANQAGYATLVAEMDGVVTQVMAEAGQVVAAGQPIIKIANPREKELVISLPEARLAEFQRATKSKKDLKVFPWAMPEKTFLAQVREVGASADAITRTYPVRLSVVDGENQLQLGMSAHVILPGNTMPGTWTVPLAALYTNNNQSSIWQVAADGKVSQKPVTVLQYRETTAVIRADTHLQPGDRIVAAGVHKLIEGQVVKP
ncbi:MAG: efflux RND transporter periplasmic adaptor subunit, partial [Betaproteobacteria bacterium]|nr:efflux RND transporter periplasmic adaptor subunit [Betaproteobacteria bacterium]